jgi:ANTAR domain/GAF domain
MSDRPTRSSRTYARRMSTVVDEGAALCAPFLADLPVAGVSISVVSDRGSQSTIGTSDSVAARLEELQFQLGEGPTLDVLRSGRPCLAADLREPATRAIWPVFGGAALDEGARGLFSVPLLMGPSTVGVVSMYARMLLPQWSAGELDRAVGLASAAVRPAVGLATRSADADRESAVGRQVGMRREVHQASGMLTVQLGCTIDEAMMRLRAYAFAQGESIDAVARQVVAGTLDFAAMNDRDQD